MTFGEPQYLYALAILNSWGIRTFNTYETAAICGDKLRTSIALFGRQTVPADSLGSVLRDAVTGGVHEPEANLRLGFTLLGLTTDFRDRVRFLPEHQRRD